MCRTGSTALTEEIQSTRRETCPSATSPAKSLTSTCLKSNPGARSERTATNLPSHGTAQKYVLVFQMFSLHLQEDES
jgi:hypothetical protein